MTDEQPSDKLRKYLVAVTRNKYFFGRKIRVSLSKDDRYCVMTT